MRPGVCVPHLGGLDRVQNGLKVLHKVPHHIQLLHTRRRRVTHGRGAVLHIAQTRLCRLREGEGRGRRVFSKKAGIIGDSFCFEKADLLYKQGRIGVVPAGEGLAACLLG